ncbi:MAG TPA: hypothetical protein VGO61_04415 [Steroidobacteraceae bacterium]|jgi:hypothetical protein|nr:hypothetical protein [Steroidobacteraceae bacterium]
MSPIRSVFIVEPENQGWIIERLMRDIAAELGARGIETRIGKGNQYSGEDVIFNSRYLIALYDARARVNSLFITHIDDRVKEMELRASFARFNSFICMSPHDAEFVAALKGDSIGIAGIELPARDLTVRPIRVAFFSARYEDGRKNEQWIIDCFRGRPAEQRAAFVFCFLGWGWESFCEKLGELEMNYEIYRYSRFAAGEYQLYKDALRSADFLIYLGFDGGAMSVYDAFNAGIDVLASNISYHRGLGEGATLFKDRVEFDAQIDNLLKLHANRVAALGSRSIKSYVDRLLAHWIRLLPGNGVSPDLIPPAPADERKETLQSFRAHYKPMFSPTRVRSFLIRWLQTRFIRR